VSARSLSIKVAVNCTSDGFQMKKIAAFVHAARQARERSHSATKTWMKYNNVSDLAMCLPQQKRHGELS